MPSETNLMCTIILASTLWPHNHYHIISWRIFYATCILNSCHITWPLLPSPEDMASPNPVICIIHSSGDNNLARRFGNIMRTCEKQTWKAVRHGQHLVGTIIYLASWTPQYFIKTICGWEVTFSVGSATCWSGALFCEKLNTHGPH